MQNLTTAKKLLNAHKSDCNAAARSFDKVLKELKSKQGLSTQEKAQIVKPLYGPAGKVEGSQRKLASTLTQTRSLLSSMNTKAANGNAKMLVKLGKDLNDATKLYLGGCKVSKRAGEALLKKMTDNELSSINNVGASFNRIYLEVQPRQAALPSPAGPLRRGQESRLAPPTALCGEPAAALLR